MYQISFENIQTFFWNQETRNQKPRNLKPFLFSSKGIPSTTQHTDSHPCTRPEAGSVNPSLLISMISGFVNPSTSPKTNYFYLWRHQDTPQKSRKIRGTFFSLLDEHSRPSVQPYAIRGREVSSEEVHDSEIRGTFQNRLFLWMSNFWKPILLAFSEKTGTEKKWISV